MSNICGLRWRVQSYCDCKIYVLCIALLAEIRDEN